MRADAFALLGISSDASDEDVRRAFRRRVLELHPDRHAGDARRAAELRAVIEAHEAIARGGAGRRAMRSRRPEPPPPPPRVRDRFACPGCGETWSFEGDCPRCALPLWDEFERGPVREAKDERVEAMVARLERGAGWTDRVGQRVASHALGATICGLLLFASWALPVHAPLSAMMAAYALFLLASEVRTQRTLEGRFATRA